MLYKDDFADDNDRNHFFKGKKMKKLWILASIIAVGSCTSNLNSTDYTSQSVGTVGAARECKVLSVRPIQIRNDNDVGTIAGGAAGGVAGSMIGGSPAVNMLGAIGGAVVGGIAGNAAQGQLSNQSGFEYVVRLVDGGGAVTVTQGTDILLQPGQGCLLLYGPRARLIPFNG